MISRRKFLQGIAAALVASNAVSLMPKPAQRRVSAWRELEERVYDNPELSPAVKEIAIGKINGDRITAQLVGRLHD